VVDAAKARLVKGLDITFEGLKYESGLPIRQIHNGIRNARALGLFPWDVTHRVRVPRQRDLSNVNEKVEIDLEAWQEITAYKATEGTRERPYSVRVFKEPVFKQRRR
jgi:hypothetical protein